jgi:D-aspartate ligase
MSSRSQIADQDEYDAVVLGLDINGLGIVRSLGKKKLKILGIYEKNSEIGKFSRYCKSVVKIKAKQTGSDIKLLRYLIKRGHAKSKPVLFATNDYYVNFINNHREILERRYLFNLPDKQLLTQILSKDEQASIARKHGLMTPRTYSPVELLDDELSHDKYPNFPLIIKPANNILNKLPNDYKNVVVESKSDLEYFYNQFAEYKEQTILQEIITGGEKAILWCTLYIDQKFNPSAIFMARPLRKYKPDFGVTCFSESIYDKKLLEIILKFFKEIRYRGLADIEFMYDKDSDQYVFIEINPRTSWVNSQSRGCGVDLSWAQYCDLKRMYYRPCIMRKTGFRWIYLFADFMSFMVKNEKKELSLMNWLKSISTAQSYACHDLRDPVPCLYDLLLVVKRVVLKFGKKIKSCFKKKDCITKKNILYT